MKSNTLLRIIWSTALMLALVSCTQKYSQEIAEGHTLYITSSKAGRIEPVDIKPYVATLSIKQSENNHCDLTLYYEFTDGPTHFSMSFITPDVSLSRDESNYYLDGKGLHGTCIIKKNLGGEESLENIIVNGRIGFDGNSDLTLSGTMAGFPFFIIVSETSFKNPGPQENIHSIICYNAFPLGVFVSNTSLLPVRIEFHLTKASSQENVIYLQSGETGWVVFSCESVSDFWTNACSTVDITADNQETATITGNDIYHLGCGDELGALKCVMWTNGWHLQYEDPNNRFIPYSFPIGVFEINDI